MVLKGFEIWCRAQAFLYGALCTFLQCSSRNDTSTEKTNKSSHSRASDTCFYLLNAKA